MLEEERLIRLPEVMRLIGIQRSTVWAWVKQGRLPKARKLSSKLSVWQYSEIMAYMHGSWRSHE